MPRTLPRTLKALATILLFSSSSALFAQSQSIDTIFDRTTFTAGSPTDLNNDVAHRWHMSLGAGLGVFPRFVGSDDYKLGLAPLFSASYDRFHFSLGGVGFDVVRDRSWRVVAHLGGSRGRKESDDSHLQGLGDVDSTLRGGITARYAAGKFVATGQILGDLLGRGQGVIVRLDAYASYAPARRLILLAGPGVTWTNGENTQSFFGVNAVQHINSGLPQFDASSGVNSLRVSAVGTYIFDRHWIGTVSGSLAQLQQDAAHSPITESRSQVGFLVSAVYVF